jgi:hypothetical protein
VEFAPPFESSRLGSCCDGHELRAAATVRVLHDQPDLVFRVRSKEQDTTGEQIACPVLLVSLIDDFVVDAQQGQRGLPCALALASIGNSDGRVAIIVPVDVPPETEILERGRIDHQPAGRNCFQRMTHGTREHEGRKHNEIPIPGDHCGQCIMVRDMDV